MSPLPSEQKINDRLLEICKAAPGQLQRIGEAFLSIRDPRRYGLLRPQGRNTWIQTTKGYPDAYAKDCYGIHVIEATVGNWRTHIQDEDLKRFPSLGKVGSYVLLVLQSAELLIPQSNSPKERAEKNEEYFKELLVNGGVPRDQIEFIFLDQLVRALRTPQYIWLLRDIGLVSDLAPFESLDAMPPMSSTNPSKEEYFDESVICRNKLERLDAAMQNSRLLVLTGLGGVGKTTTGLALSYRWAKRNPAGSYYLDAKCFFGAMGGTLREALAAIEFYRGTQTLFVIDNIHLLPDDDIARIVQCAIAPVPSSLLLLGRSFPHKMLENVPAVARRYVRIESLLVEQNDLLAMYRLYASRVIIDSHVQDPSEDELKDWHKLAPDLVLFSACLRSEREMLKAGLIPHMSKHQANDYVRAQYVANLPSIERASLIAIAKLAGLEIPASIRSLGGVAPSWLLGQHLITQLNAAKFQIQRFSLPHDNLGALILEWFDDNAKQEAWNATLSNDVFQATYIARRLLDLGRLAEAKSILQDYEDRIWHFSDSFPPSFAHTIDKLYQRAQLEGGYRNRLLEFYDTFVKKHLNFLAGASSFIHFAERNNLRADEFLRILIDQPPARLEVALKLVSLIDFAYFIKLAKSAAPDNYESLYKCISDTKVLCAFLNKFHDSTLDEINQALGIIHAEDSTITFALQVLVAGNSRIAPLFLHLLQSSSQELHLLLRHKYLVELLCSCDFREPLAQRLAQGFKNISSMMDDYSELGTQTKILINDALSRASVGNVVRAVNRETANVLYFVLLGAMEESVINDYLVLIEVDHLNILFRHWPPARLEAAWQTVHCRFGSTGLVLRIQRAMLESVSFKLIRATCTGEIVKIAVHRYSWKLLTGDSSQLEDKVDMLLRQNLAQLSLKLGQEENSEASNRFIIAALKDAISEFQV